MYCANSSKETGGSSTISEANLPAHTHTFTGDNATETLNVRACINSASVLGNSTSNGYLTNNAQAGATGSASITTESTSATGDTLTWNYTPTGTLSSTGSGEEFLPPYMTVYAWYRTA